VVFPDQGQPESREDNIVDKNSVPSVFSVVPKMQSLHSAPENLFGNPSNPDNPPDPRSISIIRIFYLPKIPGKQKGRPDGRPECAEAFLHYDLSIYLAMIIFLVEL
jgi:hypothetical protein